MDDDNELDVISGKLDIIMSICDTLWKQSTYTQQQDKPVIWLHEFHSTWFVKYA